MSDTQKDKKDMSVISKKDDRFSTYFHSFCKNEHHAFVLQKTEKLASALYMVTGFLPGEDPLKARLRASALELLSVSSRPSGTFEQGIKEAFSGRCIEIGSMLSLAERAGLVSSMNARILCDEYADLASFVSKHQQKIFGEGTVYEKDSLLFSEKATQRSAERSSEKQMLVSSPVVKSKGHKRHLSRKDKVLSLLDKKDKISVKDAMEAFEGYSEKTIQRELIALVKEGVLLKEGERRWSVYRKA